MLDYQLHLFHKSKKEIYTKKINREKDTLWREYVMIFSICLLSRRQQRKVPQSVALDRGAIRSAFLTSD